MNIISFNWWSSWSRT